MSLNNKLSIHTPKEVFHNTFINLDETPSTRAEVVGLKLLIVPRISSLFVSNIVAHLVRLCGFGILSVTC